MMVLWSPTGTVHTMGQGHPTPYVYALGAVGCVSITNEYGHRAVRRIRTTQDVLRRFRMYVRHLPLLVDSRSPGLPPTYVHDARRLTVTRESKSSPSPSRTRRR